MVSKTIDRWQPEASRLSASTRQQLTFLFLSPSARPLRFACTGGVAALLQLGLLALFVAHGWNALPANAAAFLLAAQVNFVLSRLFTWRDRPGKGGPVRQWMLFHLSIAGMALINMAVFTAAQTVLPTLVSSLLGILVAAVGNFSTGDRLIF